MSQNSMALSPLVLAYLVWQGQAGSLRGGTLSAADVENSLISALMGVVAKDRPAEFEAGLQLTFASLPKNEEGNLGHQAVRYILHRFFVKRHGWYIKGLEPGAKAQDSPSFMKGWVPAHLQDQLEKRVQDHGINLVELSALAASLESLVQKEASQQLDKAYAVMRLPRDSVLNKSELNNVISVYMMGFLNDGNISATSPMEAELNLQAFAANYEDWSATEAFLERVKSTHFQGLGDEKPGVDYAATQRIVNDIGERFGHFNDLECESLKSNLLKMESHKEGRVPLSEFYKKSLHSHWQFTEKAEYLRVLGALDETDASRPQVIVPNYLSSRPNCLEATDLYAVCCRNECEDLMGQLENVFADPSVSPDRILGLVSTMSSDTVKAPRELSETLVQRLDKLAEANGGEVPIHGRVFAQWMHHAFPRECPYPHQTGTVSPQTPDEWMKETGQNHKASEEEMQSHVDACAASEQVHSDVDNELPWSDHEELLSHDVAATKMAEAQASESLIDCRLVGVGLIAGCILLALQRLTKLPQPVKKI